jgi:hypothetical protein
VIAAYERQPVYAEAPLVNPRPWIYPVRGLAVRLFVSCWLVYALHVSTNTVREIYLALSIGDRFSFRVDE